MASITLKFNTDTNAVTEKDIANAVRRAFSKATDTEVPERTEVKGIVVKVKASPVKPLTEAGTIRQWARENGFEVGQRGRLKPEVKEAFAAAQA